MSPPGTHLKAGWTWLKVAYVHQLVMGPADHPPQLPALDQRALKEEGGQASMISTVRSSLLERAHPQEARAEVIPGTERDPPRYPPPGPPGAPRPSIPTTMMLKSNPVFMVFFRICSMMVSMPM